MYSVGSYDFTQKSKTVMKCADNNVEDGTVPFLGTRCNVLNV